MCEWGGYADVDVVCVCCGVCDYVDDGSVGFAFCCGVVELWDRYLVFGGVAVVLQPLAQGTGDIVVSAGAFGTSPTRSAVVSVWV